MAQMSMGNVLAERQWFVPRVEERYREEFALLEELQHLGSSQIATMRRDRKDPLRSYKEILFVALTRTVVRLNSIECLLLIGNSVDAQIILRTIVEEVFNILSIGLDPVSRSLLFLRYGSKERIKAMKKGALYAPHETTIDEYTSKAEYFQQEMDLYERDVKSIHPDLDLPRGIQWSGKTMKDEESHPNSALTGSRRYAIHY